MTPFHDELLLTGLQEDESNCSIFSFDVAANKNRLPMARNAVRKLRTLRHPGVIKVLDTVEVRSLWAIYIGLLTRMRPDRIVHLRRYRTAGPIKMAHKEEEHERRDAEMGPFQHSSKSPLDAAICWISTYWIIYSKQLNSSMMMPLPSMAHFESVPYIRVKAENGRLADSKSSAV